LQRAFPLDVLMVPSSVLIISAYGECPSCDVFSLGKTIHFRSLKFITDCFSGLSLSLMRDGSSAIVMDSTCGGTPSLLWAMTGDSVEEFHIASDGEGRIDLPSSRKHGMGASTAPTTTIPWLDTTPTAQAMMTILPQQTVLQHEPPLKKERILVIDYSPV
jgi:hypothetical protein